MRRTKINGIICNGHNFQKQILCNFQYKTFSINIIERIEVSYGFICIQSWFLKDTVSQQMTT